MKAALILLSCVFQSAVAQSDSIRSLLRTVEIPSGRITTVYAENGHFEAPNWSRDGRFFVVNEGGRLYRLAVRDGKELEQIRTGAADKVNNDHGISPDGRLLVLSHEAGEDWLSSSIYILPIDGAAVPRRVTTKSPSFWHGWSPDGKTLAFVGQRNEEFDIYTIPSAGGEETRLTTAKGLDDGPEYSPDGKYIYFNSERTGHMQIWRMQADGSEQEQVAFDDF